LKREKEYIRQQTGSEVRVAYSASEVDVNLLSVEGINALVGETTGAIDKTTNPMSLPHWKFKKEETTGEGEKNG
jgi:hypothetical protein